MFRPLIKVLCNRHIVIMCRTVNDFFCTEKILWKRHNCSCNSSPYKNKKLQMTKSGQSGWRTKVMFYWQKIRSCCCSSVSKCSTNVAQMWHKRSRSSAACSSPLVISVYVPYERPAISENGILLVVLDYFANFLQVFSCANCEGTT
jgi:hypothetical protein